MKEKEEKDNLNLNNRFQNVKQQEKLRALAARMRASILKIKHEENKYNLRITELLNRVLTHFKGKHYIILEVAEHTETGELLVVYQSLYDECKVWIRPLKDFVKEVDKLKYPEATQEYKFEVYEA